MRQSLDRRVSPWLIVRNAIPSESSTSRTTRIVARPLLVSCRIADLSSIALPMPYLWPMASPSPVRLTSSFSTGTFQAYRASNYSSSCASAVWTCRWCFLPVMVSRPRKTSRSRRGPSISSTRHGALKFWPGVCGVCSKRRNPRPLHPRPVSRSAASSFLTECRSSILERFRRGPHPR